MQTSINQSDSPKLLLTPREAAGALGVSERTLWSLTSPRGPIRCFRVSRRAIRYAIGDLQTWIESGLQSQTEHR